MRKLFGSAVDQVHGKREKSSAHRSPDVRKRTPAEDANKMDRWIDRAVRDPSSRNRVACESPVIQRLLLVTIY